MILNIHTQTSTQDIIEMPEYYEVAVRGGIMMNNGDKQASELQIEIVVPKSDVVDEIELLTVAELGAIAEFIEQRGRIGVPMLTARGEQCDVSVTCSQPRTETLLASFSQLVERVLPIKCDSDIPTSEYAALNVHMLLAKLTHRCPSLEGSVSAQSL